jgi:uncharacterized protein involved in exopolysaccharide biosynthesis
MSVQNPPDSSSHEEIIDLRELILTIFGRKWLILSVTVAIGLSVFLISSFLLPDNYTADAYLTLSDPIIQAELDSSIQVSPTLPEISALAELAEADAIIDQVIMSLDLLEYENENKLIMKAALQGKSQLHLEVTTPDPKVAAQVANSWAQVMILRLNDLYGTGLSTLKALESDVQNAREDWSESQEALEQYLPQSQKEVLEVQLSENKIIYAKYINEIEENRIIISDGEALKSQLLDANGNSEVSTGIALSIIALQQRSTGGIDDTQFEIQVNHEFGQAYLYETGINDIDGLINALINQNNELYLELTRIEDNIANILVDLESEKFKIELLSMDRDMARNAYTALANQLEEHLITSNQDWNIVKFSVEAIEPLSSSGPSVLINTILALITGFLLSISVVIILDWWNNP